MEREGKRGHWLFIHSEGPPFGSCFSLWECAPAVPGAPPGDGAVALDAQTGVARVLLSVVAGPFRPLCASPSLPRAERWDGFGGAVGGLGASRWALPSGPPGCRIHPQCNPATWKREWTDVFSLLAPHLPNG